MDNFGSPNPYLGSASSSRSHSSSKFDDVTSLTSFNPFSEEDENDQSSYALVSSLFSRVKNTLAAPLTTTTAPINTTVPSAQSQNGPVSTADARRPSLLNSNSNASNKSNTDRPNTLNLRAANPAAPLVSLTPVTSETPSYVDFERTPSQGGSIYSPETADGGGGYGTAIPGFPIPDSDARSIRTTTSIKRSASVSKVIRRIRGEGARFGQEGMVRVCNLCLEKLAKGDDDDDDDRRSIISSFTSPFAAHQLGADPKFSGLARIPQSPFAASQMFGRSDSFSLFSIAETRRPRSGSEESGFGSRPITPGEDPRDDRFVPLNPVPFRRALTEEERDPVSLSDQFRHDQSPSGAGSNTPIDFPVTVPVSMEGMSSVAFPASSPDQQQFGSETPGFSRSRYNSYADFDGGTFIRSRVQSRLVDLNVAEPGWRVRRESTAYAQELNTLSMFHLRIMLRQMLTAEVVPNMKEWEETLLKLALRIARELTFTAHPHRQGADMDVRRYVKIKKIPGGSPSDSEYVDGAVITKNVAHKQMSRLQRNPRVMLVTFPLEFHRIEGQYMHFGQIFRQEKEYLGNLASRIAALRPHVVLAEKSVSRLALDALASHKIAVARTVKPSAVQFVARMTQGDVFSSMDKLALEPHLGHCARFRIQTFDHPLIPGRRKTFMRFEGCNREMGCTIILRGGDIDTLKRIKKVTRFLAFIVRNLRLETHLWKDSVITLPKLTTTATPAPPSTDPETSRSNEFVFSPTQSYNHVDRMAEAENLPSFAKNAMDEDLPDEDAERLRLSKRIEESLEPYRRTFISVSATLRFLPPYPIRRMKELDDELIKAKQEWEDDLIRREEKAPTSAHMQEATVTDQSLPPTIMLPTAEDSTSDLAAQIESLPIPEIPPSPTPGGSSTATEQPSYFDLPVHSSAFFIPNSYVSSPIPMTLVEEEPIPVMSTEDLALESRFGYVKWQHEEQRRIWEWYLRKNKDDFDVEKYQCLSLWEFTIPIADFGHRRACFPPQLKYFTFYGENDCTLGQFIDSAVMDTLVQFLDPKAVCDGKGCGQPAARHCKVYVHNESRLFVAVEQWDGQITDKARYYASPDTIITWSACRVCGSATPFIPVSEEMQRYSFAKFLELHFYPADVQLVQGAGCHHNIYSQHIRYFATRGMTVRFQADPVVLHEIVYPPTRIRVRPETQLEIKNRDFERLHHRNNLWYSALMDDLKLINIDAATGDEEADALLTANINNLIARAEWEKNEVARFINQIYRDSSPTDTIALNQVRAQRQDYIVAWQQDFDRLPKPRMPQTTDNKTSRRSYAFGSVRAIWPPRRYDMYDSHIPSSSVSEAEESGPMVMRKVTGDSIISVSSASDASESESVAGHIALARSIAETSTIAEDSAVDESIKSDPESDSTIGASRDEGKGDDGSPLSQDGPIPESELTITNGERETRPASRLPRRSIHYPSVAELVKRYQDFLPPQGVEELTRTAFPPGMPVSESDVEGGISSPTRPRFRNKQSHRLVSKKASVSDFEQSYAANIAPRYLTHSKRPGQAMSRIPGPSAGPAYDSRPSSRRSSPDKRPSLSRAHTDSTLKAHRRSSPGPPPQGSRLQPIGPFIPKNKGKSTIRAPKDKGPARPPSSQGPKSTLRRPSGAGKVSNIAKHFERINKDNDKANRRYAVIRGRRARPVTSARAKVEILDSIKDAIKDESESSDSSSEADDEGGDEDEAQEDAEQSSLPSASASDTLHVTESPETGAEDSSGLDTTPMPTVEVQPSSSDEATTEVKSDNSLRPPEAAQASVISPVSSVPPSPAILPMHLTPLTSPPPELDIGTTGAERQSSILKALSGFWPQTQTTSRAPDNDDPMADPEHIFRDSSMVVRTDEPTSIIALALNSPQYRELLSKSRADKRQAKEAKLTTDGGEAFMPDDTSVAESTSTWGVVNVESADGGIDPTEELRVPSSKLPWAISFESGGLTISCTVLYPEQFDALRRTYDCEKSMVDSLARCFKWDTGGGKSGSAFMKTLDDRFITKELSRAELQAMETFAPSYFDYMSSALGANRPTLLAKIFGVFKITFRKTQKDKNSKSKPTQMNLMVMENLFYDRRFSKIYDLKGSTRNRHVPSTGRENEVLLDENLVETAHLAPFYLREHSKRILRGALFNDSRFLADINVMDYSLLVGVDSANNELVVGIVDYVRTYTWDKKLESWVKDSAFLGGGANKGEPTIIGPKQYRQRFLSAMERYLPLVPDRWMKQHDSPEEEGNNLLDLWPDW
ncbi:hypothetical protein EUX98_g3545 [Antrodiella citrinella]|uniref:1-phosphatidylinositol-3-phosphate 5-kinase n=1 Tax=Antrodiella citrinella TaxID=2447956 RepID=A0A4S4MZ07_9APHY|nr:hypothetical protein EUX98_g3545 [Antrodiella citrinella]